MAWPCLTARRVSIYDIAAVDSCLRRNDRKHTEKPLKNNLKYDKLILFIRINNAKKH